MQSKKCPSVRNPSQDIVESGTDGVGYVLNNLCQSAMGAEQNKTEDSGTINNHILRYEDGGWGDEFDAQVGPEVFGTSGGLSCSNISNSLKILKNHNEWPSGSARFFMRDHQIRGNGLRGLVFNSVMD